MKLITMGVGRRDLGQPLGSPLPKCWANGFRWLAGKSVLTTNLEALDRQRERQVSRVARRLDGLDIAPAKKPPKPPPVRDFYGFPFSYQGQFMAWQGNAGKIGDTEGGTDVVKRTPDGHRASKNDATVKEQESGLPDAS